MGDGQTDEKTTVFDSAFLEEKRDKIKELINTKIEPTFDTLLDDNIGLGDTWDCGLADMVSEDMRDRFVTLLNAKGELTEITKKLQEELDSHADAQRKAESIAAAIEVPVWDTSALA